MILRPHLDDYKIIGYYLGKITVSIGIAMMIPLIIAVAYFEWQSAVDFLFGISFTVLAGALLSKPATHRKDR